MSVDLETTPAGELFPALELSQLAADSIEQDQGSGLLRIQLRGVREPRDIQLSVSTPGLRKPTLISRHITADTVLRPRLDWDAAALLGLKEPRRQTIKVRLVARGMETIERHFEVRVHPLDEALYFVREGKARIDLGWAFAAWVDPQDPIIDDLLDLAGIEPGAIAAASLDRAARMRLARLLWVALEQRGLRYADEGAGLSQGPVIYSQRVRLLSSIWNQRVANCLDGSVLIASALERLGIGSLLVLVPGHAFVGFYVDDDRHQAEFLETTLLGFRRPSAGVVETVTQIRRRAETGFDAARSAGRERYQRARSRLDGKHRPDYALIDISTARAYGIMPLAVGRGERTADAPVASSGPAIHATSPASRSP
ncbi:MAG TPA: hypothetical protein VFN25_08640 [Dokdonella sp.]|uniref:hypothetical protein n=1 Tax=Dokdonella sp. TaxID=2291710 RepID=UPI002D7E416F|nr:hypothetical protein [Dokdonella sp.]HET9032959.1 hypothetical protein [Dokdonella sp.]